MNADDEKSISQALATLAIFSSIYSVKIYADRAMKRLVTYFKYSSHDVSHTN